MEVSINNYPYIKTSEILLKTEKGLIFVIDNEEGKPKITVSGQRIMYGTEEGNNNADFIILVK